MCNSKQATTTKTRPKRERSEVECIDPVKGDESD